MTQMIQNPNTLLSIVVPVYNEELVIREFLSRTMAVIKSLGCHIEILFVNDGSWDGSLAILRAESKKDPNIRIINLSRNFGHQIAITAGLDHARGDAVVVLDADLQDPPEVIAHMVQKWEQGFDIVHARRKKRLGESNFKLWTAAFFYRLLRKISRIDIPVGVGDFRLMSKRAVQALRRLRERQRYVRGLVAWLGYPYTFVEYDRDPRFAGETKYSLLKMLQFSTVGISSFSILPLRLATIVGFLSAGLAFLAVLFALFSKFALSGTVPGWTTVMIGVFFLGGIQLVCIGILGEYIGLLHEESKKRPLYLVDEIL